ncbi:TonB-dependent receptor [Chitinophaga sp. Cy-1792]|uniref:SusC/RagA family TonB-linked outer membrane protein n=1 Tax=Chitinophaga sp. Cy-1792 TaxID=2608339 RepID=UPI00141FB179|nr:TonB-dependent receptor [Chitinophaga sp. Cy-1792]NIG53887.1 TonB-dependent receptor [Chitinophaga sp. Cy-1792]
MFQNFTAGRPVQPELPGLLLPGHSSPGGRYEKRRKFQRMMRITTLLMLFALMNVYATGASQNITLTAKNEQLKTVLKKIARQAGVYIVYEEQELNTLAPVTIEVKEVPLKQALDQCFRNQPLMYDIVDKTVVVKKKMAATPSFASPAAPQQEKTVRILGRVLEAKDPPGPLMGANIAVKGTSKGVTSDIDGVFELHVAKGSTLMISMIGYKPQEYLVADEQANLIISLKEDLKMLDQVVVTGFGTQRVKNIASSVSTVNMENVRNKPVTQLSQALQGGSTGIQVSQTTGVVGEDKANIRIRGVATMLDASPLVLVDGVPFDMNNLDPNTVESITVLKDAAAASMYGARAANGVILITTKRGVAGVPNIEYNGYYGMQSPQYIPDFVDAATWMRMNNEAMANSGGNPIYSDSTIMMTASGKDPVKYPNTNWTDLVLRKAIPIQQHSILVSGGNTAARFALAINQTLQQGHVKNSDFSRTTVRGNTTVDLTKKFFIYMDLFASRSQQIEPYANKRLTKDIYTRIYTVPPNIISKYPDRADNPGYTYYGSYGESWNPVAMLEKGGRNSKTRDEALLNIRPQWNILPGLTLKGQASYRITGGIDKADQESYIFFDYYTNRTAGVNYPTVKSAALTARESYLYLGGNLDYSHDFGKHNVNAIAGYTQELRTYDSWKDVALRSVFGKAFYSYDQRYLLEAGIRRDGSSLFGIGHKWGIFPSMALGWNIDKEKFFNVNFVDAWKLRGSWGILGNNNIDPYLYQTTIDATNGTETVIGNPDITWEKTKELNFGTDINLKKGFSVTAEWYDKVTSDMIITPNPGYTGATGIGKDNKGAPLNVGSVRIRGAELKINYHKLINRDLSFDAGIGYSKTKSRILHLIGGDQPIISGNTIMYVGGALKEYYGYATQGLLQAADIADNKVMKLTGQQAGDIHFVNTNGDTLINNSDRVPLGNTEPTDIFFLNLGFRYKGFDFATLFSGEAGSPLFYTGNLSIPLNIGSESGTPQKSQLDYWTPTHTNATRPRLTPTPGTNGNFSDFWRVNGTFVRVRYITMGYTLPSEMTRRIRAKMLRIYFNAQNPFTFSAVKLLDPESGGDQNTVPLLKSYTLGINLKF